MSGMGWPQMWTHCHINTASGQDSKSLSSSLHSSPPFLYYLPAAAAAAASQSCLPV